MYCNLLCVCVCNYFRFELNAISNTIITDYKTYFFYYSCTRGSRFKFSVDFSYPHELQLIKTFSKTICHTSTMKILQISHTRITRKQVRILCILYLVYRQTYKHTFSIQMTGWGSAIRKF